MSGCRLMRIEPLIVCSIVTDLWSDTSLLHANDDCRLAIERANVCVSLVSRLRLSLVSTCRLVVTHVIVEPRIFLGSTSRHVDELLLHEVAHASRRPFLFEWPSPPASARGRVEGSRAKVWRQLARRPPPPTSEPHVAPLARRLVVSSNCRIVESSSRRVS